MSRAEVETLHGFEHGCAARTLDSDFWEVPKASSNLVRFPSSWCFKQVRWDQRSELGQTEFVDQAGMDFLVKK